MTWILLQEKVFLSIYLGEEEVPQSIWVWQKCHRDGEVKANFGRRYRSPSGKWDKRHFKTGKLHISSLNGDRKHMWLEN